jgi:hypothetical protein
MYFVSETTVTIRDRHDNEQSFVAGVPQIAHPSIASIAASHGVFPCAAPDPTAVVADEGVTGEQIQAAIRELMEAGDPKMFGVSGAPHLNAIKKVLGETITDAQRDAAWEAVKAGA